MSVLEYQPPWPYYEHFFGLPEMYSTEPTSPESSESLHFLFCLYILGQRPLKLITFKQLKKIQSIVRCGIYHCSTCDFISPKT
jgi:hypothetical protein